MSDRHYVHHEDEAQLAKLLKESRPFLEKYLTTMIYGVAALLAVAAVVVYLQKQPAPTADVSRALLLATTAEDYQAVADEHPDSPLGILARLRQADRELEDAVSQMFTDREKAADSLAVATKAYEQLESRKDVDDSVRERVLVGLARAAECRCDGSDATIQAASAAWERVLKEFPDSKNFKAIAESRIKRLVSEDSHEFYAWFSQQKPKPGDDLLMPQDGTPSQVPSVPSFPSLHNLGLPKAGETTPAAPVENTAAETKSEEAATPEGTDVNQPAAAPSAPESSTDPAPESPTPDEPAADAEPAKVEPSAAPPAADEPVPEKSGE